MSVYFRVGKYDSAPARESVITSLREAGFVHQPNARCEWTSDGAAIGVNLSNSLEGYIQLVARNDDSSSALTQGQVHPDSKEYALLRGLASRLKPSSIVNDYSTPVFPELH